MWQKQEWLALIYLDLSSSNSGAATRGRGRDWRRCVRRKVDRGKDSSQLLYFLKDRKRHVSIVVWGRHQYQFHSLGLKAKSKPLERQHHMTKPLYGNISEPPPRAPFQNFRHRNPKEFPYFDLQEWQKEKIFPCLRNSLRFSLFLNFRASPQSHVECHQIGAMKLQESSRDCHQSLV